MVNEKVGDEVDDDVDDWHDDGNNVRDPVLKILSTVTRTPM